MVKDLSLMASLSAIEIEVYMNKGTRFDQKSNVRELAEELEGFSREKPDMFRADLYSRFLWPSMDDFKTKTENDIYLQMNLFAKDLKYFEELSRDKQEELRENCTKLSRLAMAQGNPFNQYRIMLAA